MMRFEGRTLGLAEAMKRVVSIKILIYEIANSVNCYSIEVIYTFIGMHPSTSWFLLQHIYLLS